MRAVCDKSSHVSPDPKDAPTTVRAKTEKANRGSKRRTRGSDAAVAELSGDCLINDAGVLAVTTAASDKTKKKLAGQGNKRAAKEPAENTPEDGTAEAGRGEDDDGVTVCRVGRIARNAAKRIKSYEEADKGDKDENIEDAEEMLQVKAVAEAATEVEALQLTKGTTHSGAESDNLRSLVEFVLVDSEGRPEPLDRLSNVQGGLFISGTIHLPLSRAGAKSRGKGAASAAEAASTTSGARCRVARIGPIKKWSIKYSASAEPKLVVHTELAEYECSKATPAYRKLLEPLSAQVELAGAVHKALCTQAGGRMDSSFEDVCCRVARTKVSKQYGGARYALKLNGRFLLEQLTAMSGTSKQQLAASATNEKGKGPENRNAECSFDNGPFAQGLMQALDNEDHMPISKDTLMMLMGREAGGIRIGTDGGDGGGGGGEGGDGQVTAVDDDYELACRLMAEEYAEHMNGGGGGSRAAGGRRRGGGSAGGSGSKEPYIQVREEEIADDYPAPKEYKCEEDHDEWDELILEDPELLGCGFHGADERESTRTLDHFAIYNADGFLTTLELVPMVAGLDANVNIFASGVLAEDTGDWGAEAATAEPAQPQVDKQHPQSHGGDAVAGSGAGGSGAADGSGSGGSGGQRYFLTQIREWFVECGPEGQVVINIRTDVSWYRLVRPQKRYAPWYRVVQRVANIAIQVLKWLDEQDRASRLSFSDIVFRLASLPPSHMAYIGTKTDVVERFVVVHGQVILNLIGRHYRETIRRCGFAKMLRIKLADRRHRKLTVSSKRGFHITKAAIVENPVKMRQARQTKKSDPMPATATAQVRRIWSEYFSALDEIQRRRSQGQAQNQQQAGPEASVKTETMTEADDGGAVSGARQAGGDAAAADGTVATVTTAGVLLGSDAPSAMFRLPKVNPKTWKLSHPKAENKSKGRTVYGTAVCGDLVLSPGSVIRLGSRLGDCDDSGEGGSDLAEDSAGPREGDGDADSPVARQWEVLTRGPFGLVQCIFTETDKDGKPGSPRLQIRRLVHGRDTMLADVAASSELFLLDRTPMPAVPASRGGGNVSAAATVAAGGGSTAVVSLNGCTVADVLESKILCRSATHASRLADSKADSERVKRDAERVAAGQPPVFIYRTVYYPLQGTFRELRLRDLDLGSYVEEAPSQPTLELLPGGAGFIKDGVTYRVGDFLYVRAGAVDDKAKADGSDDDGSDSDDSSDSNDELDSDDDESSDDEEEEEEGVRAAARRKPLRSAAMRRQRKGASGAAANGTGVVTDGAARIKRKGRNAAGAKERSGGESGEAMDKDEGAVAAAAAASFDKKNNNKQTGQKKASTSHKGSNKGLRAFAVVQLWAVESIKEAAKGKKAAVADSLSIQVVRFYRPEDISQDLAYRGDWWDLYAPTPALAATPLPSLTVPVAEVYGKCAVVIAGQQRSDESVPNLDTFKVVGSYDPRQAAKAGPPPTALPKPPAPHPVAPGDITTAAAGQKGSKKQRGQGAAPSDGLSAAAPSDEDDGDEVCQLDTLDIFAGCGGLSEGMHQAGVANTRWAIEYDSEAAEAFKVNNPEAKVFCNNCNVLLRAAMLKTGLESDCFADPTCIEAATKLDDATIAGLPTPGSVAFMMGGPPCQGYSGMNRFNKGLWSQVQNSMVMAYLSFCDFYRPRYFLLENVRNFAVYRGGEVFRLVVRTLLDLGYQVRFGILNAGHYGAPQSRKRTFIWAALPGEFLPEWPAPRHVFVSAQLGVKMQYGSGKESLAPPGGYFFATGPPLPGAPLRCATVYDAIGDLPPITNDAKEDVLPYTGEPVSAFQRAIRGKAGSELRDHIVKSMNELNLERCRCIPKGVPGADWRVLQRIVAEDPSREFYKGESLVPFCLPNTADRHNGWRGLYGRLDPDGHFPTATTEPNPMGKVGQVFHPHQDRIVSVRECARSQGFPDHFRFHGNVACRHRQVGNAVPPPLARALGQQLRLALKMHRVRERQVAADRMQALRNRRQQQNQQQ